MLLSRRAALLAPRPRTQGAPVVMTTGAPCGPRPRGEQRTPAAQQHSAKPS